MWGGPDGAGKLEDAFMIAAELDKTETELADATTAILSWALLPASNPTPLLPLAIIAAIVADVVFAALVAGGGGA